MGLLRKVVVCAIAWFGVRDAKAEAIVGLNFTGSTLIADTRLTPADANMAAGREHLVELINGRMSVYRKSDGARVQTQTLDEFWISSGSVLTNFAFDPRVVFDPQADRYYAVSVDDRRARNRIHVAVSNTVDPTEGWQSFSFEADPLAQQWADFPMLGFDAEGLYVSAYMLPIGVASFSTSIFALPKADLIDGTPSPAGLVRFDNAGSTPAPQPVIDYDDTGMPARFYSISGSGLVQRWTLTGGFPAPTLNPASGPSISFPTELPGRAEQPGPKRGLDLFDARFSGSVVTVDGVTWAVQTIDGLDDRAMLRWMKFDEASGGLLQSGELSDEDLELFYGSIAVNEFGDVVVGAGGSSENQFASAVAFVGQTDPHGQTTFGDPLLLKAGVATFERLDGNGRNRWGDYTATVVDPDDPRRFWTIQEWVSETDVWSTQITELRIVPEPASCVLAAAAAMVLLAWTRQERGARPSVGAPLRRPAES